MQEKVGSPGQLKPEATELKKEHNLNSKSATQEVTRKSSRRKRKRRAPKSEDASVTKKSKLGNGLPEDDEDGDAFASGDNEHAPRNVTGAKISGANANLKGIEKKKKVKQSTKKSKGPGKVGDVGTKKGKASLKNEKHGKKNKDPREDLKWPENVFDFDTPVKFLASLIAPVSLEVFFARYWEKQPLVLKRRDHKVYADTYRTLFSRKILENILVKRSVEYVKDINVCR